jgi:hypothetical protein
MLLILRWKPLCYAPIGGLAIATFITLLLVPVFYSIFVLDLKWIKWETTDKGAEDHRQSNNNMTNAGQTPRSLR